MIDDKVNCRLLQMSLPVTRGTPEGDKDEETFNTKKRPAQEKENSPKKKGNQLKRDESKQEHPRPAFGYEYDLTDDLCGNILSYAADGNIVSRLCELQLISHKWYNIVMSETCSSESWDMAFRQKFPGLFEGPRMHTRKDCMNLTFGYNHQAWVIQRAIGRFARVNDRMNMLQSWTAQFWRESMDPCIICGVRWSKLSTERCEYSRCPFQQFLHEYGCNNKHYREKEAYHTRLFVCKTCGMRHPDKAMRTVGAFTVLCAICAEDRVRVQAVCSDDDDSSSSDDDDEGDGQRDGYMIDETSQDNNDHSHHRQVDNDLLRDDTNIGVGREDVAAGRRRRLVERTLFDTEAACDDDDDSSSSDDDDEGDGQRDGSMIDDTSQDNNDQNVVIGGK